MSSYKKFTFAISSRDEFLVVLGNHTLTVQTMSREARSSLTL